MSRWLLPLVALLPMPSVLAAPGATSDLETGIVYPSPWLAVRGAAAAFGFATGEAIDLTAGTVEAPGRTQGALSGTYFLSEGELGFGVAAEYLHVPPGEEHFVNWAGAGLGTDLVQAGFNFRMDATTWAFEHSLSLRVGKAEGLAVALRTPDVSAITTEFLLGIGYRKANALTVELNCPLNTDNMLSRPRLELVRPDVSVTVSTVKTASVNLGINGVQLSSKGDGQGKFHAGLIWWLRDSGAFTFTLNKRHVYTVGAVIRP